MIDKATLLVIDDDNDIRTSIREGIEVPRVELRVLDAPDGKTGLQIARKERPDAIILDLQMPQMNGFEFVKAMREEPEISRIPILMLTAQDSTKHLWESIDLGIDDFLGKPFDFEELEARVALLLQRRLGGGPGSGSTGRRGVV